MTAVRPSPTGHPPIERELPAYPWLDLNKQCPLDPAPIYAQLRAEAPVARVRMAMFGTDAWLVTRYEDARQVLSDHRRFAADRRLPNFPHVGPPRPIFPGNFVHIDPPEHTRLRRMVSRGFTAKTVAALRPKIQRFVDELIDEMVGHGPPGELKGQLALPLPVRVICELLGVPYDEGAFFTRATRTYMPKSATPMLVGATVEDALAYMKELVVAKERAPGDDLISWLAVEKEAQGELTHDELAGIALALMVGAYETTSGTMTLAMLLLLEHPHELARLRADPALVRGAVEEALRYISVVHTGIPRLAMEDVEVGGQLIRAGVGVVVSLAAANRDGAAFADPDRFDIGRFADGEPGRHLAFGFGIKQCVGQMLARAQLQVAIGTLVQRLPGLRLAVPLEEVPFRHDMYLYGAHELPVTW